MKIDGVLDVYHEKAIHVQLKAGTDVDRAAISKQLEPLKLTLDGIDRDPASLF